MPFAALPIWEQAVGVQIQRPDLKVLPDQTPNPDSPHEGETDITQQSVFRTKAQRDEVVELYDALEGARQHLERLGAYVAELTGNLTTKGGAS